MTETFPRAESAVEDPILEAAKALRNKRVPLTLDYAFHLVDIAAEQEGRDHVYQKHGGSCRNYTIDENGHDVGDCLIGRVFEFFVDYSDRVGRCGQYATAWQANEHYDYVFDKTAEAFLDAVQVYQDGGMDWGESIDLSKAEFLHLL